MLVRLRALALTLVSAGILLTGAAVRPAWAEHCGTVEAARDPQRCAHTPPPRPTAAPTVAPTAPPATAPPAATPRRATAAPTRRPGSGTTGTAEPTPEFFDTPVPQIIEPTISPEILVSTPLPEPTSDAEAVEAASARSSSPANWAFLVVGLVIGGLLGRMSWGLSRRRKKQQIFG